MELNIPVDFERLPEFRQLCSELSSPLVGGDETAVFIWMRLWVELAYQAQVTNRPGLLNGNGGELLRKSLGIMTADIDIFKMLFQCGILKPDGDKGWFCDRFARMNAHLAQNYVSREAKGAAASALERNKNRIAQEANQQAMLLAPSLFKKSAGDTMTDSEIQRCMILIKTLDNCLKVNSRKRGEYTEGLMADAWAAVDKHTPEALREFFIWLSTNREHPAVPKTTEQVLAKFEECFAMKS